MKKILLFLFFILMSVGSVFGDTFQLVTNISNLSEGDEIIIVNGDALKALSTTQNGNNRGATSVAISSNQIEPSSSVQKITLGKSNNHWTFYVGDGYLYAASSSKNYLRTQVTNNTNGEWVISISSNNATITAQGNNSHNLLRYNSSDNLFSCYSSGQQTVQIYKNIDSGPTKYTVSFVNELGKNPNSITQTSLGSSINLPTDLNICNKCYGKDLEFYGWASDRNSNIVVPNPFTPTKDIVLYALYSRDGVKDIEIEEYKLVTEAQNKWSGDYLISYSSTIFADGRIGGTTTGGIGAQNRHESPTTYLHGDTVVDLEWGDVYNITLEEIEESNTYVLKTKDGLYNYHTNNTSNGLSVSANKNIADDYPISVNFISSSDIQLALGGNATGAVLRYNTQGYFRFYKSASYNNQQPIKLYKRQKSIYPSPTEYSTAPECDTAFISTWGTGSISIPQEGLPVTNPTHVTITNIEQGTAITNRTSLSATNGEYVISTPNLSDNSCDKMNILIEGTDSLYMIYKVPIIVSSNVNTDASIFTDEVESATCDVVVLANKTLTVTGTPENRDVKIYEGGRLNIPSETEYTINSLSLRKTDDTNPYLTLKGNISLAGDSSFYLDVYTDPSEWRWLALPDTFDIRNIILSNGKSIIYGEDYLIKVYNGYIRALTQNNGWVTVSPEKQFMPGEGFIFGIAGSGTVKKEFRFKFSNNILRKEKQNKTLQWEELQSWGCEEGENLRPNHKGWNLIGNAFLDLLSTDLSAPIGVGRLIHSNTDPWDGKWDLDAESTGKLRYRVKYERGLPGEDGNGYSSELLDTVQLEPFSTFFVQLGGETQCPQTITLNVDKKRNMMRRMIMSKDEDDELFLRVFVGSKKTGMFISNKFTEDYEPGDDLESRQTIYQNIGGYRLLYSAIPDSTIEKGVLINSPSGKLFLDNKVNVNDFEYIYVKYGNSWYNLLQGETVDIETGAFILQAKRKNNDMPTGLDAIPTKGIYKFTDGKYIYINRNGELINVLGNKIK